MTSMGVGYAKSMQKSRLCEFCSETEMNFHRLHTELVLLAGGYMEVACPDMELPELLRHWSIRRIVDWKNVVWC